MDWKLSENGFIKYLTSPIKTLKVIAVDKTTAISPEFTKGLFLKVKNSEVFFQEKYFLKNQAESPKWIKVKMTINISKKIVSVFCGIVDNVASPFPVNIVYCRRTKAPTEIPPAPVEAKKSRGEKLFVFFFIS